MLDSKYNRFLWYCLTANLDDITNYEGKLHCEVPFGDYKINEVPDDNFYSELDKFIANNNLKIIAVYLTTFEYSTGYYDYVFQFDGAYYKVTIGESYEYGYDYDCDWIDSDLENFQVFPKKKTITVYEY